MIDKIKALLSTERNCFHLLMKKILILFYYVISYLLSSKHLLTCIDYNDLYNDKLELWVSYIFVMDEHMHLTTFFTKNILFNCNIKAFITMLHMQFSVHYFIETTK